ncbi:MAG: HIRAN domain-containing protein [Betaproteobacteria bacterium]|nr:HIRAN domain-containing protein [Betaproteobacteria bacterium]
MRFARIFRALFAGCLIFVLSGMALAEGQIRLLAQSSPLAGSQFHALSRLAGKIREGDSLTLRREPDNQYDANAVRVEWQGEMLGYVPRRENRAVAAAMDRGELLDGRIIRFNPDDPDPWQRLRFEIWVRL